MKKYRWLIVTVAIVSIVCQFVFSTPAISANDAYCRFDQSQVNTKTQLRDRAFASNNSQSRREYQEIVQRHAQMLRDCRSRNWLKEQAIWLRIYPCDVVDGSVERVLDQIVNLGYNTVYLEVFFDGRVLLPKNANNTIWSSVIDQPGYENRDLYAETLQKGRERGLKMYAWLFALNYGYSYSLRGDRQDVLALNGKGENSVYYVDDQSQTFVDPYNSVARDDYRRLLQAVLQRRPDGVLFDYIRYPRGSGPYSVASKVKDLWIYGRASRQALLARAQNNQGRWLLERYIDQGSINANDVNQMRQLFPNESMPLWQGRSPNAANNLSALQLDLWYFTVAHAAQGVIDFLNIAVNQVRQMGIPAGAVFFPEGNQPVGEIGFDSRVQPWDNFPSDIEFHPMSYALCGNASCIARQVQSVIDNTTNVNNVKPVLAGLWGRSEGQRPSLEIQMEGIRQANRGITSISHFAYSWIEPQHARERRNSCSFN
ncbi:hypothetical protein Cyast_2652 [Cyanobacterium stanieri PCC 7202]|uniref:Glycosyl hydrolase-like 10 domain-containing protein n=1 Tax=Cyanobacterium stanieri (strain ATCC 29140 / PCC 7202) TaxID=292563 RepID=K9YQC7_CYASC|nr:hypothetical protein Cyast_2652 [Cyanobacterium stanieri PCC 7202]